MTPETKVRLVDALTRLIELPIAEGSLDSVAVRIGVLANVVLELLKEIGPSDHAAAVEREMRPHKGAITSQSS